MAGNLDYEGPERRAVEPLSEEQLEFMTEQTRHAARAAVTHALKKWTVGAAIAYLLLLGGLWIALNDGQVRLREAATGSCDRVNVLRAQSNLSDLVSFNILSLSGQREDQLAKSGGEDAKTHEDSARNLWSEARNLKVTALTDCKAAVKDPAHYETPVAGPIGDPETGEVYTTVQHVLRDSGALLKERG